MTSQLLEVINKTNKINNSTFSMRDCIVDSTAVAALDDLYVASRVRIATAVSILADEKSPVSSC